MTFGPVNERVRELAPYLPGKPVEEVERELGISDSIKLASNENPRGPGPKVVQAITNAVESLSRYPDGSGFYLKNRLAEQLEVDVNQLTLGNGSNDVLELAAKVAIEQGCNGVVDEHCFVVYPIAIQAAQGVTRVVSSSGWTHDLDAMASAIDRNTRIIYLANPNNPTGTWFMGADFERFMSKVPESVWVVLDEAYFEYVDRVGFPDGVRLVAKYPNLIVTRTFSKIYGLASLRVGYSVSNPEFAGLMNRVRQPFNVNSVALAAAEAALNDTEYMIESKSMNAEGMEYLERQFEFLGIDFIPSAGNFICMECGDSAASLYDRLLRQGVIVRPIANYKMPNHLRVTVGSPEENERFIRALRNAR